MPAPPVRTEISDSYPNPSNAVARTGFGRLYDYVTGLLGSTGNQAEARVAIGVGPVISCRNRVRNGNFAVNQRGAAGTIVLAAGAYGHDGWKAGASGCTYTAAASGNDVQLTIASGSLQQVIEAGDVEGGTYCMSWAGTATGKIAGGSYAASGVTASSVTANANLTAEFTVGTLTRVQVEPGAFATPYERRTRAAELALCQRYFQVIGNATGTILGVGTMLTATEPYVTGWLVVPMRATPTATINYAGVGFSQLTNGTVSATASAGATIAPTLTTYAMDIPSSATQVANGAVAVRTVNASQSISFSADL